MELAIYDGMCRAIDQCWKIDEVKEFHDKAVAFQAYAKQAQNEEAERRAYQIRLRAGRKAGELRAKMEKANGGQRGGRGRDKIDSSEIEASILPPTLAELNITAKQSMLWQKLAAIPKSEFEERLAAVEPATEATFIRDYERDHAEAINIELREQTRLRLPKGRYETLIIDPPWPMEKIERDVRPNQVAFDYPVMSLDEIAEFPVPKIAAPDCHVFVWTTQRFLPDTFDILDTWGARYVCTFVWLKAGGFQPIGLPQYNCEFALYGRIGSPAFVDTKKFPTCFPGARREHSRKPDEFYDMIARVTAGPRIDIFSREQRKGFQQYGNETEKFR